MIFWVREKFQGWSGKFLWLLIKVKELSIFKKENLLVTDEKKFEKVEAISDGVL